MNTLLNSPATPVIVTGGASGIGLACARALLEVGRAVAIWDIDTSRTEAAAVELSAAGGAPCIGLGVDVTDVDAIALAVAESRERMGSLGGLVHAAGVSGAVPLEQLDAAGWDAIINVNLRAELFITQAMLPDLKANPGSAIVGIASINATLGNAANPVYSASKGGMLAMCRALADDLARSGIRINSVSPGQIATPMLQASMDYVPGLKERFEQRILLGRLGEPEEVGKAVRFLLSDEASYITAAELVVDGGNISSQR